MDVSGGRPCRADDLAVRAHPRRDGLEPDHCLANLLQHLLGGAVVNMEFPRDTIPDVASGSGQCHALSDPGCVLPQAAES